MEGSTPMAGAVAGSVALVVFVIVHAIWIVPIWSMLAMLPIAAGVGALAAWPFHELTARGALPVTPFDGVAFTAVLLATLIPTVIAGVLVGPVDQQRIEWSQVVWPLLLAAPAGGLLGWALTGPSGAISLSLAAVVLALTLGHNLPFFPFGAAGWEKAFGLVIGSEIAAGVAFGIARSLSFVAETGLAPR